MVRKKIERTGSYRARDDRDGSVHTINIDTELIDATTLADTSEKWIPGMQSHSMASNGNHVNVNGDKLEEIATGRRMTRIP